MHDTRHCGEMKCTWVRNLKWHILDTFGFLWEDPEENDGKNRSLKWECPAARHFDLIGRQIPKACNECSLRISRESCEILSEILVSRVFRHARPYGISREWGMILPLSPWRSFLGLYVQEKWPKEAWNGSRRVKAEILVETSQVHRTVQKMVLHGAGIVPHGAGVWCPTSDAVFCSDFGHPMHVLCVQKPWNAER